MNLPFTAEQFFDVFYAYNTRVWPMQVVLYALGILALILAWRARPSSTRSILAILAGLWFWMGIVYHVIFFSAINPAAIVFGALFILQGCIFLVAAVRSRKYTFRVSLHIKGITGLVMIIYALLIYPFWGMIAGHVFPRAPIFGLPCPTTIFTFGVLLFVSERVPWYLYIIPLIWSIVGFSAALTLGVPQDYGLLVAGVVGSALLLMKNKSAASQTPA